MKLCTFSFPTPLGEAYRVGVVDQGVVIDASAARTAFLEKELPIDAASRIGLAQVPPDMVELIASGDTSIAWIAEAIDHVRLLGREVTGRGTQIFHDLQRVTLQAPVLRPPGIACFVTWPAHIADSRDKGFTMLNFPAVDGALRAYYKGNVTAVERPGTTLPKPPYAEDTDVECEMAAVIGTGGRNLSLEEARQAIVGYTIFNDVSYRKIQNEEMKFGLGPTKGKDADHSNVLGPWIVTADEIGDPQNLELAFAVNGQQISSYHTSKMAWGFADLVAYLSKGQTLLPGQIVTSGSYPGGSGLDAYIRLVAGDHVSMIIEKIGSLDSRIG